MTIGFGIIGGSGFYKPDKVSETKKINTPFGDVQVIISTIGEKRTAFIPRHGTKHETPPHMINFRANIFAFHVLGVKRIIATSAVGSLLETIAPGDFVIPNQFIDFTTNRPKTFFDGTFNVKLSSGKQLEGVIHQDVTEPYCSSIRTSLIQNTKQTNEKVHPKGTYVCTSGPRFETAAEIQAFRILGGTLVGMTAIPEIVLARELEMCYASLCLVTNYAAGIQEKITIEEVFELFEKKMAKIKTIIEKTINSLSPLQEDCSCKK